MKSDNMIRPLHTKLSQLTDNVPHILLLDHVALDHPLYNILNTKQLTQH